jgi:3-dehydroquinate synthase
MYRGKMQSMKKVNVELGERSYEVRVGEGLLERVGLWLREKDFAGSWAVVITDATIGGLYGDVITRGLGIGGFTATLLEIPPGEESKSLETATGLYDKLTEALAERITPVLALGGGVIGDLAGFVAATYRRGLPLVQVPTTLLAQVDASIGGKTAVDYGKLKNTIGVFYQPVMVAADIDTLKTLPEEELANGLAEVIKAAAARNANLFKFLETNIDKARELQPRVLENMIAEAARVKAEIVARDEREQKDIRVLLNFGHTVGHAIEAVSGFSLRHGQAVALGMMAAARISSRMGLLEASEVARLERLIVAAGLPVEMPELDREAIMQAMQHDKKVRGDKIRFVLLKSIGNAFISDEVDPKLVREVLGDRGKT